MGSIGSQYSLEYLLHRIKLVVPLIFATLVVGIAGHGDDMKRVGKLAFRSILYFEIVATAALAVGLIVVNVVKPGVGIDLGTASAKTAQDLAQNKPTLTSVIEHAIPQNFFDAASKNEMLQIVVFAIIFAVGLAKLPAGKAKQTMLDVCESLSQVMFKFTEIVMGYAPIGIGAAIAATVSHSGLACPQNLGALVGSLYGAIVIFVLVVLVASALIARVPIMRFVRAVKEPWLIAFTTASSEAALLLAMERMEQMGVPRRIVAFVLPTGYSFNPRRQHAVSGDGVRIRSAGRQDRQRNRLATRDDADADAQRVLASPPYRVRRS